MLTLDAPIGTAARVLPLQRATPLPGTPVMLGGYEQDRAQVMVADTECSIVAVARISGGGLLLRHSYAGTRGVSGAPLLARAEGGGWAVVGVASTANSGMPGGEVVPASTIVSRLLEQ